MSTKPDKDAPLTASQILAAFPELGGGNKQDGEMANMLADWCHQRGISDIAVVAKLYSRVHEEWEAIYREHFVKQFPNLLNTVLKNYAHEVLKNDEIYQAFLQPIKRERIGFNLKRTKEELLAYLEELRNKTQACYDKYIPDDVQIINGCAIYKVASPQMFKTLQECVHPTFVSAYRTWAESVHLTYAGRWKFYEADREMEHGWNELTRTDLIGDWYGWTAAYRKMIRWINQYDETDLQSLLVLTEEKSSGISLRNILPGSCYTYLLHEAEHEHDNFLARLGLIDDTEEENIPDGLREYLVGWSHLFRTGSLDLIPAQCRTN